MHMHADSRLFNGDHGIAAFTQIHFELQTGGPSTANSCGTLADRRGKSLEACGTSLYLYFLKMVGGNEH